MRKKFYLYLALFCIVSIVLIWFLGAGSLLFIDDFSLYSKDFTRYFWPFFIETLIPGLVSLTLALFFGSKLMKLIRSNDLLINRKFKVLLPEVGILLTMIGALLLIIYGFVSSKIDPTNSEISIATSFALIFLSVGGLIFSIILGIIGFCFDRAIYSKNNEFPIMYLLKIVMVLIILTVSGYFIANKIYFLYVSNRSTPSHSLLIKAISENDPNLCGKNKLCYYAYYYEAQDVTACSFIEEDSNDFTNGLTKNDRIDNCYSYFANKQSNPRLCDFVQGDINKISCLKDIKVNNIEKQPLQNGTVVNDENFVNNIKKQSSDIKILEGDGKLQAEECRTSFTMAFVLLETQASPHNESDLNKLELIKSKTSERFLWATRGLAQMDTSYKVAVMVFDESEIDIERSAIDTEATKKFIENYGDKFDFITFYTTYETNPKKLSSGNMYSMYHKTAQNRIDGIGKMPHDGSSLYDSDGRLLGINWMGMLYSDPRLDDDIELAVNGVLHETSHQWGVYIDFIDARGKRSDLLRNGPHWNKTFNTWNSVLGGFTWKDNKDGTFTSLKMNQKEGYADIDLYLMGLLPKEKVMPMELIYPEDRDAYVEYGSSIIGYKEIITIDQIVDAMGEIKCVAPEHM